jgi:hypothetical protein
VNREAEPAEDEGEQENEQDDAHMPVSFFLYGRRGPHPATP